MKKKLIIAIDGPAGSGKSSTAKALATKLGLPYVDTGAMYRAVTLKALMLGIDFSDKKKLAAIARMARIHLTTSPKGLQKVFLDGKDVSKAIREPELTEKVFHVAQVPAIRREMVRKQRLLGKKGGAVMDGRDIGTKVFPHADFKFFFVADERVRAARRVADLKLSGKKVSISQVLVDQKIRDRHDYGRKEGPLRQAKDAMCIDTSQLTIPDTIDTILPIVYSGKKVVRG